MIAGVAGGFASGLVSTGSLRGALEGAVFGGLSAGLAYGIGHGLNGGSLFATKGGTAIAHGVAQGTTSVLRGGKFKEGFAGGFMGHMAGGVFKGKNIYTRTAFSAAVGGTISKAVGGKFANGAVSAAFTHLFNSELERETFADWVLGNQTVQKASIGFPAEMQLLKAYGKQWNIDLVAIESFHDFTKVLWDGFDHYARSNAMKLLTLKGAAAVNEGNYETSPFKIGALSSLEQTGSIFNSASSLGQVRELVNIQINGPQVINDKTWSNIWGK